MGSTSCLAMKTFAGALLILCGCCQIFGKHYLIETTGRKGVSDAAPGKDYDYQGGADYDYQGGADYEKGGDYNKGTDYEKGGDYNKGTDYEKGGDYNKGTDYG